MDATYIQGATVQLNLTGLLGLSIWFGTSRDGMSVGVQLVSTWMTESKLLQAAVLLESVGAMCDRRPAL